MTSDGKIVIVDTSEHIPGHIGLVVYSDEESEEKTRVTYLLSGDTTYGIELLENEQPDGIIETLCVLCRP